MSKEKKVLSLSINFPVNMTFLQFTVNYKQNNPQGGNAKFDAKCKRGKLDLDIHMRIKPDFCDFNHSCDRVHKEITNFTPFILSRSVYGNILISGRHFDKI